MTQSNYSRKSRRHRGLFKSSNPGWKSSATRKGKSKGKDK